MYNTVQLYILSVQVMLCAAVLLPVLNNAKERVANALMSIKGLQSVVPILVLAYGAIFASASPNALTDPKYAPFLRLNGASDVRSAPSGVLELPSPARRPRAGLHRRHRGPSLRRRRHV